MSVAVDQILLRDRSSRGRDVIDQIIALPDDCDRTQVERILARHSFTDADTDHVRSLLVDIGRIDGGYCTVNGRTRAQLTYSPDRGGKYCLQSPVSWTEIARLVTSLLQTPTRPKIWALITLAKSRASCVAIAKLVVETGLVDSLSLPVTNYLAASLQTWILALEEINICDTSYLFGPHFSLSQMQACQRGGLFPSECAIMNHDTCPLRYVSSKSRNTDVLYLVDDQTAFHRLDQFMIQPEILLAIQKSSPSGTPILAPMLRNDTAITGSFLTWALVDRARSGHLSKEQEMAEYYDTSDLDIPTVSDAGEVTADLARKLDLAFGPFARSSAQVTTHQTLQIYVPARNSDQDDAAVIAELPALYREMPHHLIRYSSRVQVLQDMDWIEPLLEIGIHARQIDKYEIRHPVLIRHMQVYRAYDVDENSLDLRARNAVDPELPLFSHVIRYHFACVRAMMTSTGVYMSFSTAAALIHGEIVAPWRTEITQYSDICAKYVHRGYRIHCRMDALSRLQMLDPHRNRIRTDVGYTQKSHPLPDHNDLDAMYQSLTGNRSKPARR